MSLETVYIDKRLNGLEKLVRPAIALKLYNSDGDFNRWESTQFGVSVDVTVLAHLSNGDIIQLDDKFYNDVQYAKVLNVLNEGEVIYLQLLDDHFQLINVQAILRANYEHGCLELEFKSTTFTIPEYEVHTNDFIFNDFHLQDGAIGYYPTPDL